jgi:hypothetical protein
MIKVKLEDWLDALVPACLVALMLACLVALIVLTNGLILIAIVLIAIGGYFIAAWEEKRGRKWWL